MDNYLNRACEYLSADKGSVINPRIEGDDYVLIVDWGIAGSKKHYIPLSALDEPKAVVEDTLPVPVAIDLNYRALQELAKEQGIPANQSADDLYDALFGEEEE